jgi:hypothetical protein
MKLGHTRIIGESAFVPLRRPVASTQRQSWPPISPLSRASSLVSHLTGLRLDEGQQQVCPFTLCFLPLRILHRMDDAWSPHRFVADDSSALRNSPPLLSLLLPPLSRSQTNEAVRVRLSHLSSNCNRTCIVDAHAHARTLALASVRLSHPVRSACER